jgi:hypothetical protein
MSGSMPKGIVSELQARIRWNRGDRSRRIIGELASDRESGAKT